jgi:site-specific recombinase XerD
MKADVWAKFLAFQQLRAGALGDHIAPFAEVLADRGYATFTKRQYVCLIADLGRWLGRGRLPVEELDEARIAKFLEYRRRRGRSAHNYAVALSVLLELLRDRGVVRPAARMDGDATPVARVVREFEQYLAHERGLSASSLANYVPVVGRFLSRRYGRRPVMLDQLRPRDVSRFVVREARAVSSGRAKLMVTALRAFLSWLYRRGVTDTNLSGAVPTVAHWRLASLPKSIPSSHVERLLRHCDRSTMVGQRDYAILLLLARLGLRAGEVVAMELDDLDWEAGELVVRGKGRRHDRLPLPRDVGAAVASYLRHGRPSCSTRRVFVRIRAPRRGFASSVAICNIVERALARATLDPPRKGAHLLRHALACSMLRAGASLAEIGDILRHRSPDTTAIYAKVDVAALRALAPAWPCRAGGA